MTGGLIHDTAVIDQGVEIGEATRIWHFAHVSEGAVIGAGCVLGQNVFVGKNVCIGNRVKIQNSVSVYAGVTIEDDVFLGPSCVFTNVSNPRAHVERKDEFSETLVRKGATIGANATVLCGVELGPYSFVGAGSVVTRSAPAYALLVGNPARRRGWACRCGEVLPAGGRCERCGERYEISDDGCTRIEP